MANERKKPAKRIPAVGQPHGGQAPVKKTTRKKPAGTARRKGRRKTNGQSLFANRWVQAALALVIVGALAATVLALGNRHQRVTYDFGTDAPFVEGGVDISEHNGTVDWTTLAKSAKFAFIRVGYRGYTDGALHADKMAKRELKSCPQGPGCRWVYISSLKPPRRKKPKRKPALCWKLCALPKWSCR